MMASLAESYRLIEMQNLTQEKTYCLLISGDLDWAFLVYLNFYCSSACFMHWVALCVYWVR